MIFLSSDKWLNSQGIKAAGKAFVQRWLELFHRLTLDSYRVRHLNLRIASQELLGVINDFEVLGGDAINVKDVAAEALHLLKEDPVANTILPNSGLYHAALAHPLIENGKTVAVGLRVLTEQIVRSLNGHYRTHVLRDLRNAVEANSIELTVRLTDVLASDLIHEGYDLRHLYWKGFYFIKAPVKPFQEKFDDLLARFRSGPREEYAVHSRIVFSSDTDAMDCPIEMSGVQLSSRILLASTDPEASKFSKENPTWRYSSCTVNALDPFSASRNGASVLSRALDVFQFARPNTPLQVFPASLVRSTNGKSQIVPAAQELLGPIRLAREDLRNRFLQVSDPEAGVEEITRSKLILGLQFLRRGLGDLVPHGQFLSFWIGLEAVAGGKIRTDVAQVRRCLSHTIALGHPARILTDLRENLERLQIPWHAVIEQAAGGSSTTLESLWRCIGNGTACKHLAESAVSSPLLQHRIEEVARHFSTSTDIKNSIERHAKDVDWHIQRMYRIRNSIVHGGGIPDDLTHIGSHLATYLWTTLRFVLDEIEDANGVKDLRDFFDKVEWLYDRQMKNLIEAKEGEPPYGFLLSPKSMMPRG